MYVVTYRMLCRYKSEEIFGMCPSDVGQNWVNYFKEGIVKLFFSYLFYSNALTDHLGVKFKYSQSGRINICRIDQNIGHPIGFTFSFNIQHSITSSTQRNIVAFYISSACVVYKPCTAVVIIFQNLVRCEKHATYKNT